MANAGNTRSDAKFDIDGASGTLAAYADLGKDLGDARFLLDGEGIQLGRSPRFFGQHVSVPRRGVARTVEPSTTRTGSSETSAPTGSPRSSTRTRSPSATRSCFPPDLITAYIRRETLAH